MDKITWRDAEKLLGEDWENRKDVVLVDWQAPPHEVMRSVNNVLRFAAESGVAISRFVEIDTQSDSYAYVLLHPNSQKI